MRKLVIVATAALVGMSVALSAQQTVTVPVPVPAKPPQKPATTTAAAPKADAAAPSDIAKSATAPSETDPKKDTPTTAPPAPKAPEKPKGPPARDLFGAAKSPAPLAARAIGFYAKGCLAGGKALPVDGPAWQAMRLSRNRNWGHPEMVALVERLGTEAKKAGEWPGLLVGDLAQPRGGPMTSGHASHQVGLDADIWLTPMPDRRLSEREREDMSAISMLKNWESVDPAIWSEKHAKLIQRAASYAEVERIFVHPAIKKQLCQDAGKLGPDRAWLAKIRPWWDHHYHFHVRIACPKDSGLCSPQKPIPGDDGCGKELDDWYKLLTAPPKPPVEPKAPPPPPMTIDKLPAECRVVLETGPGGVGAGAKSRIVPASAGAIPSGALPSGAQVFAPR